MTRNEISEFFIEAGWIRYRDEVGMNILVKRLNESTIDLIPQLFSDSLSLNPSVSIDVFDKFDHLIGERDVDCNGKRTARRYVEGSIICQSNVEVRKIDYTFEDIVALSDQILEWAASADIEAGLAALRALPTDCLGAMPVRHLAALAVAGDVETLEHYRDSFAAGDRLDFVPYIDEGYIARALDFAQKRRIDPNWMPDKPKLRV